MVAGSGRRAACSALNRFGCRPISTGEVDAVSAAEIERHVEHCSECRELLQDLEKVRGALRSGISYATAPPALRSQILEALDRETLEPDRDAATGSERAKSATPRKSRTVAAPASLARRFVLDRRIQRHRRRRDRSSHGVFSGAAESGQSVEQ